MTGLILWIGVHGKKIGWTLLLAPIIWDILLYGMRSAEEISIKAGGVLIMVIGAVLIGCATGIDKSTS